MNILGFSITALFGSFLAYVATRSNTFRIQRHLDLKAPAENIFPFINDLHNWKLWSPYEGRDPAMSRKYSGSQSGKGAVYEWDGNKNVGAGRMEIITTTPASQIVIKLDFIKPFEGHSSAEFTLEPLSDGSRVTWAMYGQKNYVAKMMHCFIDMDKMIGTDFQTGLANLKTVAEKEAVPAYG